ncbi:MAG: hypothetical protein CL600_05410, partial [Alteromonas sp.]|nr:hypothetical protein [Alteromonas sp.]
IIIHYFFSQVGARNTQLSGAYLIVLRMLLSSTHNAKSAIPLLINKISYFAFLPLTKTTEEHILIGGFRHE